MTKIQPKNKAQGSFLGLMKSKVVTIATGSAGTGKSFLAAAKAAEMLSAKEVKKIIVTRPNVAISTSLGFFPGALEEKMAPWVVPIMSNLELFLGKGMVESQLRNGNIEVVPFETIRGRSFDNCFVILDEAQNTTVDEMKAFVTRIGEYTTCVITGDLTQTDLGPYNGLWHLLRLVENSDALSRYVGRINFTSDDIVRSGICQLFVEAFEADKAAKQPIPLTK
jgi:phosphate starvation-inducible PhoH-like protein